MLHFCVDSKRLNAVTNCDSYTIPQMNQCIVYLGKPVVLSALNANDGYQQAKLEQTNEDRT